ncbi:hypothetical protein [Gemmiger formicilis]
MYKHQAEFLKVTQEYTRQINLLLDMAEKSDRKRIEKLSAILQKLKSSLQKLTNQQEDFKRYINNAAKYKAMLKPYIDLLESTKAEIERLQK